MSVNSTEEEEAAVEEIKKTNHEEGSGVKVKKHVPFTEELSTPDERRTWEVCEKLQVRSSVWKHFWIYRDHKFAGAVCKHCYTERHDNPRFTSEAWEVKYGGVSANTSHLERHFKAHHKDLYAAERAETGIAVDSQVNKEEKDSAAAAKKKRNHNGASKKSMKGKQLETVDIPVSMEGVPSTKTEDMYDDSSVDEADNPPPMPFQPQKRIRSDDPSITIPNIADASTPVIEAKDDTRDFDAAYSCLIDVRKCRYKAIDLGALIEEIGIDCAKDLQSLDPEQVFLLAAVLKPVPSKTFREALQL